MVNATDEKERNRKEQKGTEWKRTEKNGKKRKKNGKERKRTENS